MLASLLASIPQGLDFEVVLVDDCSSDDTRNWLGSLVDPRIRVLLNEQNLGFARSNHAGIKIASGDTLTLLNNDLLFDAGWLEPMLAILNSPHLQAGIVGNLQFRFADGELDHAGVDLNFLGQFDHIRTVSQVGRQYTKVDVVTGACMLVRKADFELVGGFDERFVNGCEDIDFCFKMRAVGKNVYLCNQSSVQHHVSLSRSRTTLQNERNSRLLYEKWRDPIKGRLASKWANLLSSPDAAYAQHIHGNLSPEFIFRPQIAARLIAESRLQSMEHYWRRTLDGVDPNLGVELKVRSSGTRYIDSVSGYVLANVVRFEVEDLSSARNFYVCGRILRDFDPAQITISLTVNNIQTHAVRLGEDGWNFNVGIIDPIFLNGVTNVVEMSVGMVNGVGFPEQSCHQALLLTHIVIDDKVIKNLH